MRANYTEFVESLSPNAQSVLGGVIFMSIFSLFSVVLLGDMHHQIRRIERVLRQQDRYVY